MENTWVLVWGASGFISRCLLLILFVNKSYYTLIDLYRQDLAMMATTQSCESVIHYYHWDETTKLS